MTPLQKLLDARAKAWSEAQGYRAAAESENRDLTRQEDRVFTRALDDVERLDVEIARAGGSGDASTYAPSPVPNPSATRSLSGWSPGEPLPEGRSFTDWLEERTPNLDEEQPKELSLHKYLRGAVTGDWRDADTERRAMSEGVLTAGGHLVPSRLSASIIDLARTKTRVMQAGATVFPMDTKKVTVARWAGDPAANWRMENEEILKSDGLIGSFELDAQTLAGLTVVSRELLEDGQGVEEALRAAFAATFQRMVDAAALYGTGVDPQPLGVKNTPGITTITSGANGAAVTNYGAIVDLVGALQDADEEPTAVILGPRTERAFANLADTTGQPLQPPQMIADLPRYPTTQMPTNLAAGTSSDTSDIFVADWTKLYIGLRTQMQITVLTERYAEFGQVGFLSWWRGDIAAARPKAFAVKTGVRG